MPRQSGDLVCITCNIKNVKEDVNAIVARSIATLLKRINAEILPLNELVIKMKKDFIMQHIVEGIIGNPQHTPLPSINVDEFSRSIERLTSELAEPCSICFKEYFSENVPLITNCCYKAICYDCFAKTAESTATCPYCRKGDPLFPSQRYYVPLPSSNQSRDLD
jgi:hypothetical protein